MMKILLKMETNIFHIISSNINSEFQLKACSG
jgi:hypothetical protein